MFKLTRKSSWVTSHPWFLYSIYDRITRQISWVTTHPWFLYSVYAKITRQISWVTTHPWFLYTVYVRILRQISWVTTHPWFYIVRIPRQISWVTAHPWFLYRGLQKSLSLFYQQFVSCFYHLYFEIMSLKYSFFLGMFCAQCVQNVFANSENELLC